MGLNGRRILIHGLGQTPDSWKEVRKVLGAEAESSCAPDLMRMVTERPLTWDVLYQTFSTFCQVQQPPLSLCGLSLGAILALQYGAEHPDRVRSMCLVAPQIRMPKGLLLFQSAVFRCMPERAFAGMGFPKQDFLTLTASMRTISLEREAASLTMPVQVVCGEKDRANRRAAEETARMIPHGELHIVPGGSGPVASTAVEP